MKLCRSVRLVEMNLRMWWFLIVVLMIMVVEVLILDCVNLLCFLMKSLS